VKEVNQEPQKSLFSLINKEKKISFYFLVEIKELMQKITECKDEIQNLKSIVRKIYPLFLSVSLEKTNNILL
jgi:hypothetical protein